jgi:hypothetical protein
MLAQEKAISEGLQVINIAVVLISHTIEQWNQQHLTLVAKDQFVDFQLMYTSSVKAPPSKEDINEKANQM